jgi:hypothetical protein
MRYLHNFKLFDLYNPIIIMLSIRRSKTSSAYLAAAGLFGIASVDAHTVFMCIYPGVNQIVAYGGTYHTGSKVGGMILAGGVTGNEQYDPICSVPYPGYSSGSYAGEVYSGITNNGAEPWGCGTRFNWETGTPLTFAQMVAEAPTANCDQIGDSASYYPDITSTGLTWNRVTIPVNVCDETATYALITTADQADDTPWMNIWAKAKCVDGDPTKTPNNDIIPCEVSSVICPGELTVSADASCQALVDLTGGTTYEMNSECGAGQLSQDNSLFDLGTEPGRVTLTTDGGAVIAFCETHVTVVDTTRPEHRGGTVSSCLWPPNHKYMCYENAATSLIVGSDNCDGAVEVSFLGCKSNQPENSVGDGHTFHDCFYDAKEDKLCYRAERQGGDPDGRTYTSLFALTDDAGNVGSAKHNVYVPHDGESFDVSNCDIASSNYKGKPNRRNLRS